MRRRSDETLSKAKRFVRVIRPYLLIVLVCFSFFAIFHWVLFLGVVPTESMQPTISGEDSLILGTRNNKEYVKGEVVVFRKDNMYMVKRIAYTEGDVVNHQGEDVTVPEGCFYMLGDNAANSFDSRYWAEPFVPEEDIVAKIFFPSTKL